MPVEIRLMGALVLLWSTVACGVKGDPVPPQRPAEIGRGRPTYKRATERVKIQPQIEKAPEEEKSEEDQNEENE